MTEIVARRWITARDLARDARRIFDELERTGGALMVSRNGRPVAKITAVGEAAERARVKAILGPRNDEDAEGSLRSSLRSEEPECRQELERAELDEVQERLLLVADEMPQAPDGLFNEAALEDVSAGMVALGMLEVKGLMRKTWTGHVLTPRGARVARALEKQSGIEGMPES